MKCQVSKANRHVALVPGVNKALVVGNMATNAAGFNILNQMIGNFVIVNNL
jgi:hypothetical protein